MLKVNSLKHKRLLMKRAERMSQTASMVVVLLFMFLLTGCADSSLGDLQNYVSDIKSKKGSVPPLPEFLPVENFVYNSDEFRDPFITWRTEVSSASLKDHGGGPDQKREKEELEEFPLDTLRMMGVLEIKGAKWGLVKASDGVIYRIKTGSYIGHNHGKVTLVDDESITLTEVVPNGLGGWEDRQASLTLNIE